MTSCLTPTTPPSPRTQPMPEFDDYYWDAVREAAKISNGRMSQKHFNNLVLFIMCYRSGLLDDA